jgi:hypothetical protein
MIYLWFYIIGILNLSSILLYSDKNNGKQIAQQSEHSIQSVNNCYFLLKQ